MASSRSDLPQDLEGCYALIERLQKQVEQQQQQLQQLQKQFDEQQPGRANDGQSQLEQVIDEQQKTIEALMADIALLKRQLFGSRRERFAPDPRQGVLFDEAELEAARPSEDETGGKDGENGEPDDNAADKPKRRNRKGRGRRVFPDFLPRKPVHHELNEEDIPEELRNDPRAKRFFKKTHEEIEFVPPSWYVIEHYREVIVKNDETTGETTMATAATPPRLIDAYTGPSFWAHLTASRFADHLPYYRLEDIFSRCGFRINRSTQWRWMAGLAEKVTPLVDLMRELALKSFALGVDETGIKMLQPGRGTITSYLWATIGDAQHPYDCFYFTPHRKQEGPDKFLSGYQGYLLSDAYICYELISARNAGITKVACWAHARRKFEELHFTAPSMKTHMAMAYFQRLYDIEDRGRELSDEARYELRQREAKPLVAEFREWLVMRDAQELPKSNLRGAIGYMLNRFEAFERYLQHGAIPFDNNQTEAAIKIPAIGRKNWLFLGNERAGATAATFFTLTKTCTRHHVDPYAYLRDVYTRLPTLPESELSSLLPDRWIEEHPEHVLQERVEEAEARALRRKQRRTFRRRKRCG